MIEPEKIPFVYREGYKRACAVNPELAGKYIEQTVVGDPLADAIMDELASCSPAEVNHFIKACMQQDEKALVDAPEILRDYFDLIEKPPEWFDPKALYPGYRAFHSYSDLFISGFFIATVKNVSSLISKAFHASGRVLGGFGLRRIRQNLRHLIEIMLPDALDRRGDGWKLSVRIRLIHARLRQFIRETGAWDESVYGVPLSSAHMALASANFSALTLRHAEMLGANFSPEMRNGYMQVWRYASWLVGTPDCLVFEGDYEKTLELSRIAHLCEPLPNEECITVAHALIEALPLIAGKMDPAEKDAMTTHAYRVSRVLIGNGLCDKLEFPQLQTTGFLHWLRLMRRAQATSHKLVPNIAQKWKGNSFSFLLEASLLEDIRYQLPDHLDTDKATPW